MFSGIKYKKIVNVATKNSIYTCDINVFVFYILVFSVILFDNPYSIFHCVSL